MFWIAAVVMLASIALICFALFNSGMKGNRDNTGLATFVNHPDCFVRVTDKTNYELLKAGFEGSGADFAEYAKNNLEIRIYDIRSALYNFPEGLLPQYSDILAFPGDIHELMRVMENFEPQSSEPAYIFKNNIDGSSDMEDGSDGFAVYGFSAASLAAFLKLNILVPDKSGSTIKHFSEELSVTELLDLAKEHKVTIYGSNKNELFQSAYKNGLLSKLQIGSTPPAAYRVTENYYPMEQAFFEAYCGDIKKNLEGASKMYSDRIIDQACKVNLFSKTRTANRLTVMLNQLRVFPQ